MAKGACYLFLGPELGEKKDAIDALRAKMTAESGAKPEETSFYAGETAVPEMISRALTGSLFASSRIFFIKNADCIKKKEESAAVCSYIAAPADDTALILISDATKIDGSIEKAVESAGKSYKKIFWELFEEKKAQYVARAFRDAGFTVDDDAIAAVLELVENNTDALRAECSRLTLFLRGKNAGTRISAEKIEELLAHGRQETVFSLFSAIARGDFTRSLGITRALLAAQTRPIEIFGFLASALRKLRDYCELMRNGGGGDLELRKIGISALGKKDYASARRLFGDGAADALLSLTAEYHLLSISASAPSEVLMDMYLYNVFSGRQKKGV
jgi:DNA polymerase-3 subunit delta